jgi:hypothetical protein
VKNFDHIIYETPSEHVARIVLNRVATRNSQDTHFLYELNDAFDAAAQDDRIKVIVLAANGPHFSSGHDLRERNGVEALNNHKTVGTWCGFSCVGAEAQMSREKELYIGLCERWRNIPKPTIAAVQGRCIMGGLMLIWPCDIIIASDIESQVKRNSLALRAPISQDHRSQCRQESRVDGSANARTRRKHIEADARRQLISRLGTYRCVAEITGTGLDSHLNLVFL